MPRKRSQPQRHYAPGAEAEYWDSLGLIRHDASRDYDRTVLTLATGALALSITFAHDIAPHPVPGSTTALAAAWILLAFSAVTVLAALYTCQHAFYKMQQALGEGRTLEDLAAAQTRGALPGVLADRLTGIFTVASGVLLVAGLVAFMCFALMNLP